MNFELKNNTSTNANEGQAEIQLPPLQDAKEPTSRSAPRVNKRNGKKQTDNKQEWRSSIVDYLLESTTSKRWNNFMITNAKDLTMLFVVVVCFHFTPPRSSPNWQRDIIMQEPYPIPKVCIRLCTFFSCIKTLVRSLNRSDSSSSQSLSFTLGIAIFTR